MFVSRIRISGCSRRSVSTLYLPENVLCQENKEKTISKFVNMQPIRRQSHLPQKKAAVLIPLCIMDGKMSLLYTLRACNLKNHRGQVSFPGGMQDNSDKNIIQTALRETQEELGIDPESVDVWCPGKEIVAKGKTCVTPVIGYIRRNFKLKDLKLNRSEVEEAFYVSLEDLCNPKNIGHTNFRRSVCMPVFTGGKLKIWGLTGVITFMFLKCLLPQRAYSHHLKELPTINVNRSGNDPYYFT